MMRFIVTIILLSMTLTPGLAAHAVDFDPREFGVYPEGESDGRDAGVKCRYLRDVKERPEIKVWSCSDYSIHYGPKDIWSRPGDPAVIYVDPTIRLKKGVLLKIETYVNNRYCGGGKTKSCSGREVISFSYLIVDDMETCNHLGPRLSLQQYLAVEKVDYRRKVQWFCEPSN